MDNDLAKFVQMSWNLVQGCMGSHSIYFEHIYLYHKSQGPSFYIFTQILIKITIKWVIKKKKKLWLDGIPQDSRRCLAWSFTIFLDPSHPLESIIRMSFTTLEDYCGSEKLKGN